MIRAVELTRVVFLQTSSDTAGRCWQFSWQVTDGTSTTTRPTDPLCKKMCLSVVNSGNAL